MKKLNKYFYKFIELLLYLGTARKFPELELSNFTRFADNVSLCEDGRIRYVIYKLYINIFYSLSFTLSFNI